MAMWSSAPSVPATSAPSPRGQPLLGNLIAFGRDPLRCCLDAARAYGDVVRLRLGPIDVYLVSHPDGVQHVLQEDGYRYRKELGYALMRPLLGNGLLISEGAVWRRRRRQLHPPFHRQGMQASATVITRLTAEMLVGWAPRAAAATAFDLVSDLVGLTRRIISTLLCGAEATAPDRPLTRALALAAYVAEETTVQSTRDPIALARAVGLLPIRLSRSVREAMVELDRLLYAAITARRSATRQPDDLLAMLLEAPGPESGQPLTDQEIRDELVTLFLAGHETTAIALGWTWYLLAQHPVALDRLEAELATVLHGRWPTTDALPELRYSGMVVQEAMRLYPPAWMILRTAVAPDLIAGMTIPAGASVLLSPYVTHRSPQWWEQPEQFDPDRFSPERQASRHRFAYLPFGGGPRLCLGSRLAMVEAQLILATVAQAYRLTLAPSPPVRPQPLITLRPHDGLWVVAHTRTEPPASA